MRKKQNDKYLIIAILLIGLLIWGLNHLLSVRGQLVEIKVDGEIFGTYSLYEDQTIIIDNAFGKNEILIENGEVYIKDADCPDRLCVRQGHIRKSGQTIICLPHRLEIIITGEREFDAVAS